MTLGPRDGTDARFDDDERVGRVGESIMLGDDAELHVEPYGHPGLFVFGRAPRRRESRVTGGRGLIGLGVASAAVGRL